MERAGPTWAGSLRCGFVGKMTRWCASWLASRHPTPPCAASSPSPPALITVRPGDESSPSGRLLETSERPFLRLGSLHGAHAVTVPQGILSSAFGLVALPPIYFAYVGGVTVCYLALVEVVKRRTMLPALA